VATEPPRNEKEIVSSGANPEPVFPSQKRIGGACTEASPLTLSERGASEKKLQDPSGWWVTLLPHPLTIPANSRYR